MRLLGVGVFEWYKVERQTGRYGAFHLSVFDPRREIGRPADLTPSAFRMLVGKRVRLIARPVDEPTGPHRRTRDQVTQAARRAARARSVDGEIELGVGILSMERMPSWPRDPGRDVIVLRTGDRAEFWMAPRTFHRLQGCHVAICAELTDAPFAPSFEEAYGEDPTP